MASISLGSRLTWTVLLFLLLGWIQHGVAAETISLTPSHDTTLFEFDPSDMDSPFNSNGAGDFFSAGRSRSRGQIRRGLLRFDFSQLPADVIVVPGSAKLMLEVVDSPRRDMSGESRGFWLVPVQQSWSEGESEANAGISGSGSGAAATAGDATWLHTMYDPAIHDPRNPKPADDVGYWTQEGIVGDAPVDPSIFGDPTGTVPAAPYLGPVAFSSDSMEADINSWLARPGANFGWLIVGDERIAESDRSSNRGFASREHAIPPILSFEYTPIPEPSTAILLLLGFLGYGVRTFMNR